MGKIKGNNKKIVILDTHAIIHRAYHALPEFINSKGEPTGAIYGLSTMIMKIISEISPDYIVACYDLPKKTFRHEAYKEYKAGRAKADDGLVSQIIKSKDFFKAFSIPTYECEGFEADDLLGTISEKLKSIPTLDIIIASGDMDTLQLIEDKKIQVYTLKKGINDTILYDEKKVIERFGFLPKYLPDYKGLRGDPSDNIIGIKGIGEKTATILISKYHTIEELYKNLNNKKKLTDWKKIGITERIFNILKEGEDEAVFSKTLATIRKDAPIDFVLPEKQWKDGVDREKVSDFFREIEFKSLQNRFLNLFEDKNKIDKNNYFENEKINKKDEEEAKIGLWLLNSEITNPSIDDVINYKNSSNFKDAFSLIKKDIEKNNLTYVYENIEKPIIDIIDKMEKRGILIDIKYLKNLSEDYHKDLSKIEKDIWKLVDFEFNINSPKQLSEVLFDKLGLSIKGIKKSAGGAISTRESELEKLKDLHPVVEKILEYRELQKLLSTYIDTIPNLIEKDGRLHANFIQTGTTTGRFASSNPNLQNIPIKSERGKNIRNAFVSPEGYCLVSFDYSQIELRVAALLSQDSYFIKSFKDGKDIHSAVAARVFHVEEEDITYEMRRRAKVINFGILYGMGVNALRENLKCERKEAQEFYDAYFKQFPTIASYLESIKDFAKKNGYTETLFGRKRFFPGIKSSLPYIRAMTERMAVNAPIQGTATADIIKIGMRKSEDSLKKNSLLNDAHLVMQIHDELIYEIKKDKLKEAISVIEKSLIGVIPVDFIRGMDEVPLAVSFGYGKNWGEIK